MTTSTSRLAPAERETKFLESVQQQTQNDSGAKAILKRALTDEPRHLRAAYPLVLPYLGGIQYHQDEWIFVACLSAYYPQGLHRENRQTFGHSARRLTGEGSSKGPDRRFRALLDTSLEDLRSPLSALVRLMKSKDISIDYPQLLADLCRWEHPDQYIQDKWARAFWGAPSSQQEEQPSQNNDD